MTSTFSPTMGFNRADSAQRSKFWNQPRSSRMSLARRRSATDSNSPFLPANGSRQPRPIRQGTPRHSPGPSPWFQSRRAVDSVQFSAPSYVVTENGTAAILVVTRIGLAAGTVTVDYATSDGTAVAAADYTAASGTLTFSDGETSKTVTIPIPDDSIEDGDESFRIRLLNPSGVSLGSLSEAIVTIADDDVAGKVEFSSNAYTAGEMIQDVRHTGHAYGGQPRTGYRRLPRDRRNRHAVGHSRHDQPGLPRLLRHAHIRGRANDGRDPRSVRQRGRSPVFEDPKPSR